VERGREGGREGQKSVRGIIRSYLATAILLCGYHRGARYSVVINNGDKGLLLHRFKQYLRRTMSRNYHCPFPTADYASSFNASLEYDRVANKWRINVSASRRCSAPRALSLSLVTAFLHADRQHCTRYSALCVVKQCPGRNVCPTCTARDP